MRIRWNSIVTVVATLAVLVLAQVMTAVQAPPAGGQRGAAAAAPPAQGAGAAAPAQAGGRGGGGRGGRGGAPAPPIGPVPRLPNGKPDLSGLWANPYTNNMAANVFDPTKRNADGTYERLTWEKQGEVLPDAKGGRKTFDLPYTEWGRKEWEKYDVTAHGDYAGTCLPFGWSRNINSPHGVQIMQNNDAIAFLFEQNTWHTWIPTNPSFKWPPDLPPTWNGTSVGRWEGDKLIVETTGFNGYTKLDTTGHPHSKDVKFISTFLRTGGDTIEHTVTVHDPKTYTKDWMNVRVWKTKRAGDVLMEYSCEENNLGLDDGGVVRWKFPETVD